LSDDDALLLVGSYLCSTKVLVCVMSRFLSVELVSHWEWTMGS